MQYLEDFTLILEPGKTERHYWKDIWRYRELFYFLAWRDILVRYKQTILGVAWALVRPVLAVVAFTVVFGKLAKLPAENTPYPVMVFAALLPWQFFASAFSDAGNSLVGNASLISKVYFPRLIIPTSAVIVSVVDLGVSGVLLGLLMAIYGVMPSLNLLALPLFGLLAFGSALGPGLWVASFNVRYRDARFIAPFVVQAGLYISPVGFSSTIVPDKWRLLYSLNPLVGTINGFRWAIFGGKTALQVPELLLSVVVMLFVLVTGIIQFRRTEKTFADVI